jgi:hypothetical protein
MIDLMQFNSDTLDLDVENTDVMKAKNILDTQTGSLNITPELRDFGVDLEYFIQDGLEFQNESFRAYLVSRLVAYQLNVASIASAFEDFSDNIGIELSRDNDESRVIL